MRTSIAVPFICFSNSSLASLKKKSANGRMSSLHSRNGGMCRAYSFSRWYRSARKRFSAMAVGKSSLVAFCDTHVGFLVPVAVHICTFYIPRHGAASAVPLSEGYLSSSNIKYIDNQLVTVIKIQMICKCKYKTI